MTSSPFETVTPDPIVHLDRVAATDLGRSCKSRMLDELDIRPGRTVLDLATPGPTPDQNRSRPRARRAQTANSRG
ncbi:hypothetical protein [Streptomyces sp. NPDC005125]